MTGSERPVRPAPVREISTRQLGKQLSAILAEIRETGVTIVVTSGGVPVARLGPLLDD
jgi:antitoxin (DNA-binding transcriptional repressor) of toxin-antitoxin stability system